LLIAGYFDNTGDFDPGSGTFNLTSAGYKDVFVSKLNNLGNFIWAKQFGGVNNDFVRSIVVDDFNNVYTTGTFAGTVDFDPGSGTFNLVSIGNSEDVFISKLDVSGNFMWAQQIGNSVSDQVFSISLDGSNNIYTCGTFNSTVDFDPGPLITNLTSKGKPDLFILKLYQCNPPPAIISASGPTTFCAGSSVTLNANTGAGLTYQWFRSGVLLAGATSSSLVATSAGNYQVYVSNAIPCSETSNTIVVTVPCIPIGPNQERASQNSEVINVFPNPSSGIFVIDSPPGVLQIFNSFGQIISVIRVNDSNNTADLSEFPDGIYIMKLSADSEIFIKRIVLNR
jgi:hypothetical protein